MKLRLTIVVEYPFRPEHYDTQDINEAAKIDQESFTENPEGAVEMLSCYEFTCKVEPLP